MSYGLEKQRVFPVWSPAMFKLAGICNSRAKEETIRFFVVIRITLYVRARVVVALQYGFGGWVLIIFRRID